MEALAAAQRGLWKATPSRHTNVLSPRSDVRSPKSEISASLVKPHLLDVLGHGSVDKAKQRLSRSGSRAARRSRNWLMALPKQMNCGSGQHQISRGSLFLERPRHFCPRAQTLRQGVGHVRQGKSRSAGYNEFAFAKQSFGLMPFRNVGEGVNSCQKKKLVAFLE